MQSNLLSLLITAAGIATARILNRILAPRLHSATLYTKPATFWLQLAVVDVAVAAGWFIVNVSWLGWIMLAGGFLCGCSFWAAIRQSGATRS